MTIAYHPGERAVQERMGQAHIAQHVGRMIRPGIPDPLAEFLAQQPMIVVAAADAEGNADASHRGGNPGFLQVLSTTHLRWPDYRGNSMFMTLGKPPARNAPSTSPCTRWWRSPAPHPCAGANPNSHPSTPERTIDMRPPLPPFDLDSARIKVRAAESAWNSRDPETVAQAYTEDSVWRNRDEFVTGRAEIVDFLKRKWARENGYALRKELWGFRENRMAVRFQYEWHDESGQWHRSYGNELWEFTPEGLMSRREASINDIPIAESERRIFGPRPEGDDTPLPIE